MTMNNKKIIDEINAALKEKSIKVKSIKTLDGSKSRCAIECEVHGLSSEWENPSFPTINKLKSGVGCSKCAKKYKQTETEAINSLNNITLKDKNIKVLRAIDYKGVSSKCVISCEIHGDSSQWENPWTPSINQLKKVSDCIKCSRNYKQSKEEIIKFLNECILDKSIKVRKIVDYKNTQSKCVIVCNTHGDSSQWAKASLPSIASLKRGSGCAKCSSSKDHK